MSIRKRLFDLSIAIPLLLLLLPVFAVIALCITLESRGGIFMQQRRIGQFNKPFQMVKFRTLYAPYTEESPASIGYDAHVTRCGYWLRKLHLDDLPQLLNVIRGEMSLVGPRPEIPEYVALYPDSIKKTILSVPVGMTDYAEGELRQENELLATSLRPEADYIEKILPLKLAYHQQYVHEQSLFLDLKLLFNALKRLLLTPCGTLLSFQRLPIVMHDLFMVTLSWTGAILIRFNFTVTQDNYLILLETLPLIVTVQCVILWYYGLHQGIWRFVSLPDVATILRSAFLGVLGIIMILVIYNRLEGVPRSSLLFYPFLLIFLLGMPRLIYRLLHEHTLSLTAKPRQRVLVLGAGTAGDMLVRDMLRNPKSDYIPIGFLDDQQRLQGGKLQGVTVLGGLARLQEMVKLLQVDLVMIAMPSASDEQMSRAVALCEHCGVAFRTLPKLHDIVNQQVTLREVREVSIEDLLGRAKVELDWKAIESGVTGKVVLVSGGGGSIGSELCRQIARLKPAKLVILERSEFNLYQVEMQLKQEIAELDLHCCLGDVSDKIAMQHILAIHRPKIIFHAAAYKHVPMLQFQVREAVRNNILGTQILAQAAIQQNCDTFVLISTDKAVNPTNIMGATKRAAEILCQAMNIQGVTKFITVRFGNVLGSAGSVVPLFKQQIAQGGPVTVTHPEVSRYFMTIPEATQLILQAGAMGQGGEIFVLDMGKPIKIRMLAEQMIRLSGKVPERQIKIIYTGLRPGEKLHEELFHSAEKFDKTMHSKIFLAAHRLQQWENLAELIDNLSLACDRYAEEEITAGLLQLVPELTF
jgi:FlaA1/EpsC-like NDP-sugar epimerase/lipopolysaccharide/colanic/teichoic acid biosynthesis glycosyltransferase